MHGQTRPSRQRERELVIQGTAITRGTLKKLRESSALARKKYERRFEPEQEEESCQEVAPAVRRVRALVSLLVDLAGSGSRCYYAKHY